MNKKLNIEEVQSKIDNLNLKFKILEYQPSGKKSKFEHICGHIFETKISHLLNRNRCPICDGKWRNKEMFQNESNKVHNSEYEIIKFENGNKPVEIKHKICGSIFNQIGNKHLRGDRCFNCYGTKKLSKEDIIERSKVKWDDKYEILSDEVHYSEKAIIRHKECGFEYRQLIYAHLLGSSCPKCSGNAPLTISSTQEKSDKVHNFEYEILSEPKGAFSKIEIRHKLCGNIFTQSAGDHVSGAGCNCTNISKGERLIENILVDIFIEFEKQKTFDSCKFKNKLRFDFYLPSYNTCIEFDGLQHFKPVSWFGGKKIFELQKIKDEIKNKYCDDNNINLIRFKYDDDLEFIKKEIYLLKEQNLNNN